MNNIGDLIQYKIPTNQPYAIEYLNKSDITLGSVCEIQSFTYNNGIKISSFIKNQSNGIVTEVGVGFIKEHFVKWNRTSRLNYLIPD